MDYILQAVSTNGCAVFLLISLLLNYRRKHGSNTTESRLFLRMLHSNLLQCIVETATIVIDGKLFPGAIPLATVLNAFLFGNNILFAFSWALYAEAKIGLRRHKRRLWDTLKRLPALAVLIGTVANLFTPVFFRITPENVYQRVGIYGFAFVATYFYLAVGLVTVFIHKRKREKTVFLPALTFLFPVCLASLVQLLLPGISLLWAGSAIGLASAYMNLLDESAFTDKLSGLFSRHYLNLHLSSLPERTRGTHQILGIMMDVDNFKAINDSYGHLMGDDAITAVGEILRSALPNNRFLFRYAGDEFVAIMPIEDISEVQPVLTRIREQTDRFNQAGGKPYHLRLSMGYTTYIPGENPNSFLDRMDASMYQDKRLSKRPQSE